MPTTNDSRAIKISIPSNPKILISIFIVMAIIGAGYLLGCKNKLLPASMCGASDIKAAGSPTPAPSKTPLPLALVPTPTLPACAVSESKNGVSYCGAILNSETHSACNPDGTATYTIAYMLSSAAAQNVKDQLANNVPVDTNPPGVCTWTSIEEVENSILFRATMTCIAPSETIIHISSAFAGESCDVNYHACPPGTTMVTSLLESEEKFYCMPEADYDKSKTACAPGLFYDPKSQCCGATPNSGQYSCANPQLTQTGFTCDINYNGAILTWIMPACAAPTPTTTVRDSDNSNEEPACIPDPSGGGCP